jgi:8-oxo-dGTP pyrophosphatase MutT (NUDIX family)
MLRKVTDFIFRNATSGLELLLLHHPYAGWQLIAGTCEEGETPEVTAAREAAEEAALTALTLIGLAGTKDTVMPAGKAVLVASTRVFARPDPSSFDWIALRPGMWLDVLLHDSGYTQIKYEEPDRLPDPQYTTYALTGWVPDKVLSNTQRRWFFLLECSHPTEETWQVRADNHTFTLKWFPLESLPDLIPPQDEWLKIFLDYLKDRTLSK